MAVKNEKEAWDARTEARNKALQCHKDVLTLCKQEAKRLPNDSVAPPSAAFIELPNKEVQAPAKERQAEDLLFTLNYCRSMVAANAAYTKALMNSLNKCQEEVPKRNNNRFVMALTFSFLNFSVLNQDTTLIGSHMKGSKDFTESSSILVKKL